MAMANNWTIKIADKFAIKGESAEHPGEIPVVQLNFNISRAWRSGSDNTNAPEGHPTLGEIMLTKDTDIASPKMYFACCSGTMLGKVVITGWTTLKGEGQEPVNVITLENVGISSINMSGQTMGQTVEAVSLAFTKVTWLYRDVDVDGKEKAKQENSWDASTNKGK